MNKITIFLSTLLLANTSFASPEIISAGSMIKMLLVLVVIVGGILLLNKFANKQFTKLGSENLSVIASIPIGQKERAVLLDVLGEKILVGVSPGTVKHLSTIHTNKDFKVTKENE